MHIASISKTKLWNNELHKKLCDNPFNRLVPRWDANSSTKQASPWTTCKVVTNLIQGLK